MQKQQGFSAWTLLPWLLFFMLAFVFWWFVNERMAVNDGMQPITPAQVSQTPPVVTQAPTVITQTAAPVLSYKDAVARAQVSVVNIYTTQKVAHPYSDDPAFREFLQYHGYAAPDNDITNLGSGVIVDDGGYIITNAHVVDKADEIVVVLSDGRKALAKAIGSDKDSDLAVIKIELPDITPIKFKQDFTQVGDVVLAIGNPFGVGQTVTQGIVSATGRTGLGVNVFEDFIQTDAAINPGNSGGALVDATGELVGINTMIYSRSGGSMGIGFAIPNAIVQKVMADIIATGRVNRGWLGIEIGRTITDPRALDSENGVMVAGITAGGPADRAGLQVGDVIVAIDGQAVDDANTLIAKIAQKSPNSQLPVQITRQGSPLTIVATLGQRPDVVPTVTPRLR